MSDRRGAELTWETRDGDRPEDEARVLEGLDAFNAAAAPMDEIERFQVFARLEDGSVAGGALARTWGCCCELQQIWVAEELRGAGIGSGLLDRVEHEAVRRGCNLLYLDSFSFQAPSFYTDRGFQIACTFPGFPKEATKFILRKTIG